MNYKKEIINTIRKNSRTKISIISRKHKVATNTLYFQYEKIAENFIKKNVSLLNYEQLGYKRWILLVDGILNKELLDCDIINNAYRTRKGYILDCLVKNKFELLRFIESVKNKIKISIHPVLDELKIEEVKI